MKDGAEQVETGRKKVGAMLGDRVEVGCNSVLNPGTVIGPDSNVYPTSCVRASSRPAMSIRTRTISSQRNELTELGRRSAQPQFFHKSRRNERRPWAAPINSAMRPERNSAGAELSG